MIKIEIFYQYRNYTMNRVNKAKVDTLKTLMRFSNHWWDWSRKKVQNPKSEKKIEDIPADAINIKKKKRGYYK